MEQGRTEIAKFKIDKHNEKVLAWMKCGKIQVDYNQIDAELNATCYVQLKYPFKRLNVRIKL